MDLKKFHNALEDKALEPTDPFYVPYLTKENHGDPLWEIATNIQWSAAASVNLLSGQTGSGKSTELRRLRSILESLDCVVFLSDMREYIHMTKPIELTDFFISIMISLKDEFLKKFGEDLSKVGYFKRMVEFLGSEVSFNEIKLPGDIGEITASLKDDPTFKQRLQEGLRGHVAKLVQQAHEFASEVVDKVRTKKGNPNCKVVFLIDSLEQIRGVGTEAESVYQSIENLFSGHSDKLHFPLIHMLYTIPPYLTPLTPGLGSRLGGSAIHSLPSFHVFDKKNRNPNEHGIKLLKEIISKRYPDWETIFSHDQIQQLAISSGGDIRDFFRLLRGCLIKASSLQPFTGNIPQRIIKDAEDQLRRDMLPIAKDDLEWLRRIHASKNPELPSVKSLPELARFFDTKLVLNYRNDEDWYDIHPLLDFLLDDPNKS